MIGQDGGVEREAHEGGSEERQRPRDERAVRDAPPQPREGRAEERPAQRQPLALELERDRDGHESERGPGDESEPPAILLGRHAERQEAREERRQPEREGERKEADDAVEAAVLERDAKEREKSHAHENREEIRLRRARGAPAEDDGVRQAEDPDARPEDERLIPAVVARRPEPPDVGGQDRERSAEERHVRDLGRGRHREEGDEEERERGEVDGHRRRAGRERRRDRRRPRRARGRRTAARANSRRPSRTQAPTPQSASATAAATAAVGQGACVATRANATTALRPSARDARVNLRRPLAPRREPRGDGDEREGGRGPRVGRQRQALLRRDEEQQDVPEKAERRESRRERRALPQARGEGGREEVEEREPHGRGQPRFHEVRRHRLHEPRAEDGERRDPADGVQESRPAEHGEREEPGVEKGEEAEEEPPVLSVRADARDVEREERRERRRDGRRPSEDVLARARLAARERRSRGEDERKHEEDPGREAQVLAREEADDPAPLVARREDQARDRREAPTSSGARPRRAPR